MSIDFPRKANFGCGPFPLHPQDIKYMKIDSQQSVGELAKEWLLIDFYIKGPGITNWDITKLNEIPDEHLEEIYCSHALEHISHRNILPVLMLWYRKMAKGGKITINVPDIMYAFKQLKALDNEQVPDGLYNEYYGLHGIMSIIFGTHSQPGEYHLGGFTANSLQYLLEEAGFQDVNVEQFYDQHDMDVLLATATK